MKEELLHYVWQTKQFTLSDLKTVSGKNITIHNFGLLNHNAGPDFSHARISIDDTEWSGHVELHLSSSDWNKHGHQNDSAYNAVILHVVYQYDKEIFNKNKVDIPTLELKGRIPFNIIERYTAWQKQQQWIPCEKSIPNLTASTFLFWAERLAIERLEYKIKKIEALFISNISNWEETTYQLLAIYLGGPVNADAFLLLAQSTPLNVIQKIGNNIFQLEALLLGQAGFLNDDFSDEYALKLKKEYTFLKHKFQLTAVSNVLFKFSKLRPSSFPTIRIAQFAQLLGRHKNIFQKIIATKDFKVAKGFFQVCASDYWQTTFRLEGKIHNAQKKQVGDQSVLNLCINIIAPLTFYYGTQIDNEDFKAQSLALLEALKPEKNSMINNWSSLGLVAKNAKDSQALIQLKKTYCDAKKCLSCSIGHHLLKEPSSHYNNNTL